MDASKELPEKYWDIVLMRLDSIQGAGTTIQPGSTWLRLLGNGPCAIAAADRLAPRHGPYSSTFTPSVDLLNGAHVATNSRLTGDIRSLDVAKCSYCRINAFPDGVHEWPSACRICRGIPEQRTRTFSTASNSATVACGRLRLMT